MLFVLAEFSEQLNRVVSARQHLARRPFLRRRPCFAARDYIRPALCRIRVPRGATCSTAAPPAHAPLPTSEQPLRDPLQPRPRNTRVPQRGPDPAGRVYGRRVAVCAGGLCLGEPLPSGQVDSVRHGRQAGLASRYPEACHQGGHHACDRGGSGGRVGRGRGR